MGLGGSVAIGVKVEGLAVDEQALGLEHALGGVGVLVTAHRELHALGQHLVFQPGALVAPGLAHFHDPLGAVCRREREFAVRVAELGRRDGAADFCVGVFGPGPAVVGGGGRERGGGGRNCQGGRRHGGE